MSFFFKLATTVEPTSHPLPLRNVFRADVVVPSLTPEEALSGAPAQEEQRFQDNCELIGQIY